MEMKFKLPTSVKKHKLNNVLVNDDKAICLNARTYVLSDA